MAGGGWVSASRMEVVRVSETRADDRTIERQAGAHLLVRLRQRRYVLPS